MIASDIGRAGLLASIPVAYALDSLTFGQLYAVAFLTGTFAVIFDISHMTLYVAVTKREDYVEANSLLNGSRAFSYVAGPSLGGILVQILSAPAALLLDAFSFLGSALFLGRIRAAEPPLEPAEGGMWAQMKEGMRFILGHNILRPLLASVATLNFFNFVFAALFILYATRELHVRSGTLGIVLGAGAIGGLLGAAVTGRLTRALSGTAPPRPPCRRHTAHRTRNALHRRVSLWTWRHDPRHQRGSDHHGPHTTPATVPVDRRSALRQLRRTAPRRARGRRARRGLRPASDSVVRRSRRGPRSPLARPFARSEAP
jgi:hypothetical protein